MAKPFLILCLGNEILSDDSFGFKVSNILNKYDDIGGNIEVAFAPLAGFNLLDLLKDRAAVLIVDTIITSNAKPGTIHYFPMGHFTPSKHLTCSHQVSLPTALEFGRLMGMALPQNIDVLAIEAQDTETLSEEMTENVSASLEPAIETIKNWITLRNNISESDN